MFTIEHLIDLPGLRFDDVDTQDAGVPEPWEGEYVPAGDELPPISAVEEQVVALAYLTSAPGGAELYRSVSDAELLELAEIHAAQARHIGAQQALIAGEVARRSRHELGFTGMAQSLGHRTPEELIRVTTGSTMGEAKRAVAVGTLMVQTADAENAPAPAADPATGEVLEQTPPAPAQPWMVPAVAALRDGSISVEKVDAIRRGLGEPDPLTGDASRDADRITAEALRGAVELLLDEARALDVDRLLKRARELRDELDEAGVATRERRRYEARSFRVYRQPDGMTRATWVMDPETAAIVTDMYDRTVSPKLGGPRFVDADAASRAAAIVNDPRTAEQLASDAMLALLRAGASADPMLLPGHAAPAVRVLITRQNLTDGRGVAHLDGQTAPVSVATAERAVCTAGTQEAVFDQRGRPLDLGRTVRLFTTKQKTMLAIRDGGCMFPGCERPPSWTEAHHIKHYVRDRGDTNIDDGILLCRHHHLLVHAAGWEIEHEHGTNYRLIPPPGIDRTQTPIPLATKSAAHRRLTAAATARSDAR
ncbi:HNH endonuclease signature motif containing protein [Protaetiibacter intestinalis]|uniref:HNH endonuclease n=1 Tax=Protaetiibacter intestinalis TaxID=2419774 RepID=A0A387B0C7_9MICO|nr:HNH endonuclease signature motif containing protein [Protaetiibacter intestinalis]AYF96912.1 HNH endonuclease [Protaetiibacter intestinalis]